MRSAFSKGISLHSTFNPNFLFLLKLKLSFLFVKLVAGDRIELSTEAYETSEIPFL